MGVDVKERVVCEAPGFRQTLSVLQRSRQPQSLLKLLLLLLLVLLLLLLQRSCQLRKS